MFKVLEEVSVTKNKLVDLKNKADITGKGYEAFLANVVNNLLPMSYSDEYLDSVGIYSLRGMVGREIGCKGDIVIDRKNHRILYDIYGMKTLSWNDIDDSNNRFLIEKVKSHKKAVMIYRLAAAMELYKVVMNDANWTGKYQDNDEARCRLYLKILEEANRFMNFNKVPIKAWYKAEF